MATIKCPMAKIVSSMAEITSPYGENYSSRCRKLLWDGESSLEGDRQWRQLTLYGNGCFFRCGSCFALLKLLRNAPAIIKRKASQPRGRERSTMQLRRQILVQRFDYHLDELEKRSGFNLLGLAIDRGGYRLSAGRVVAAQEHRKELRSQVGGDDVRWTAGPSARGVRKQA